jgi:hypothetical protein
MVGMCSVVNVAQTLKTETPGRDTTKRGFAVATDSFVSESTAGRISLRTTYNVKFYC